MEHGINTSIKSSKLIKTRHTQIIEASIILFRQKGFHQTTTREIAKQAGFSIGTLYEYVRKKEDVLYLVYESIEDEVYSPLRKLLKKDNLNEHAALNIIKKYYELMNRKQDEVVILYQEIKSVSYKIRESILQKEREVHKLLRSLLQEISDKSLEKSTFDMLAHNILVQGHMWCFRRWELQKQYTLEEFIKAQQKLVQLQLFKV